MSNTALPIKFQQIVDLTSLGINSSAISFATLTLPSDRFICIREPQPSGQMNVVILDLSKPHSPTRRPITADAAIMHPTDNTLALKAGQTLQVFDIQQKKRLQQYNMTDTVIFWKWITSKIIALVTKTSVYHWEIDGSSPPKKVFDRLPEMSEHQIINYHADKDVKWMCVVGIAQKQDRIVGNIQLYSVERKVSQPIEGHAAGFVNLKMGGSDYNLFCFASRTPAHSKLYITEVGNQQKTPFRKSIDVIFPQESPGDFPVAIEISDKYGVVYMITKFGYLHIFDIESGKQIFMRRISDQTIFVTTKHGSTDGILGVSRNGQVLSISIDNNTIVQYICNTLNDFQLARKLASRADLPGADDLFQREFQELFKRGDYMGAAKVAAESPRGVLRNQQTIRLFQQLPSQPGQPSPLLQYFGYLLEFGKLNKLESLELARPVIQQGRKDLLEKWLREDKLECSDELGDLARSVDGRMALSIYYRADSKEKVVQIFAETGDYDKLVAYAKQKNFQPNWIQLLQSVIISNPKAAVQFAKNLCTAEGGALVDPNTVVDAFYSKGMVQETTSFLLDVLNGNRPEDGALQTKLLEINLTHSPQGVAVADAILGNEMFSHYNKKRIAQLCEQTGLFQRALENYQELTDIKRVLKQATNINRKFLMDFFGQLTAQSETDTLECLKELLRTSVMQNLQVVVQVAAKYSDQIGAPELIKMFEEFNSFEGVFLYLQQVISFSQDPEVHFKYIEAAAKINPPQVKEIERIVRESKHYEPERVKTFLKEAKLPDQLPLVIVCDLYNYVDDLTKYLYQNNMSTYIEAYVKNINPSNTPIVVGALLDCDCNEDYIRNLVNSVGNLCPVEKLVEEVEKRNRLKLLQPFLEARFNEGNQEPATHNAIAKIYIDINKEPENFLLNNQFYDSRVVGKYCENRDPYLAFVAYKRGLCDYELIDVTNKHALFKHQARYLVERQDGELWSFVLKDENEYKQQVVNQVVQTALPESDNPEEVSSTVKAFMTANLPNELIELLEKIVLENSKFSQNKNLQNLLILTAIKAEKRERVLDYINRLDNYDAPDIANIAIGSELFEEAFVIFKKFKHNESAIQVLIEHMDNIERAFEFAERCDEPKVFSKLAKAQLDRDMVKEAIESYIKANDPEFYHDVIQAARKNESFEDLVKYLEMCRKSLREPRIESELIYAFAKTGKLADLEDFITGPNCAQIQLVGDQCFSENLYEAAKILFNNINNYSRLASTLVKLKQFPAAVDAARKANSTNTWKEVNRACVDAEEFRLAQVCGLHIIIHGDELEDLTRHYESRGAFNELISLMEAGLGLDRAHVGMFTGLAILYSKYKPEKLMDHLKIYHARLNIPRVCLACEQNEQWSELAFLYVHYDEYDKAARTMIEHSVDAWEHLPFKEVIVKVSNLEIYYKAIEFYIREHPTLVNDLLGSLAARVNHTRVVDCVRRLQHLPMIKNYLIKVQEQNVAAVNDALNELYIEEEDFEELRRSIDNYDSFDSIALAKQLEKHELIEFRRIAAYLYKQNERWEQSVELSKDDNLFKDAMETAANSGNREVAEKLITYFVENQKPHCFAACLFTCYDLIRPDVALELAWRYDMMKYVFPFLIQFLREYTEKVDNLEKVNKEAKNTEVSEKDAFKTGVPENQQTGNFPMNTNPLMSNTGSVPMVTGMGNFGPVSTLPQQGTGMVPHTGIPQHMMTTPVNMQQGMQQPNMSNVGMNMNVNPTPLNQLNLGMNQQNFSSHFSN